MSEKRKLSAILFADISGYTAMMQENEKQALLIIGKFKSVIESETVKFNGRIIQFFGDGCLLSFESSTAGLECAMALQIEFIKSPNVPVRIGMHMGEVVFRNNNAFGDGVNIASRIESMGVPGSILVSKTINDQVINKSSFILSSLGSFEFVNVLQPMEVFALANEGFIVPAKSELHGKFKKETRKIRYRWLIPTLLIALIVTSIITWLLTRETSPTTLSDELRQQPVAVMSFENLTKDNTLDDFGLIIKDWISYGLLESGKVPIIVLDEKKLEKTTDDKLKFAAIPIGVGIVINGRFFNQSDEQIATVAEIIDVKTKKVLFTLNPVVSSKDSIMIMLDDLKKKIIEYWGEKNTNSGKKPPLYKAYVQYLKGLGKEESNYLQAKAFFDEALKSDSTFNTPLFALATLAINNSKPEFRDSVMLILKQKENSFTSYEKKNYESLKTRVIGDIQEKIIPQN